MKDLLYFGIVVLLVSNVSLCAQTSPPSTEQKPESPAVNSDAQAPKQPVTGNAGADCPNGNALDVLSDTRGVDFGPYLARVLHDVKMNWYLHIPESARAPIMKRGKACIEFAVLKNGSVAGMKLTYSSGDAALDRAAWQGITGSNPFPPLPSEFGGQYLALRFKFLYNPASRVEVSPAFVQLASGAKQQFAASVPGAIWSLSCAVPSCGSISPSGLYTAPLKVSVRMTVTVTATLAADPIKNDSGIVTILPTPPQ